MTEPMPTRRRTSYVGVLLLLLVAATSTVTIASARPDGAAATCAHQSFAHFPGAYSSPDNLVVGPLVLIGGGRFTTAKTVRTYGGNKFPALVAAGHRVTVELSRRTRRTISLGYGPLPQNRELTVDDGHRVVDFRACGRRRSGSDASGRPVTFWSGFVLASAPRCVRLRVWVDDEPEPRLARLPLGRRC